VEGDKIRFGLSAVKNVGETAIQSILSARAGRGKLASLFALCEAVDLRVVNRRVMESLIKSGALDSLGAKRSQLMAILDRAMEMGSSIQKSKLEGQRSLLEIMQQDRPSLQKAPQLPDLEEWPANQLLAMEKEVLGFYLSGHPLRDFESGISELGACRLKDLSGLKERDLVTVCGLVGNIKRISTKNGGQMAFLSLEDLSGTVEVVVFPELYTLATSYLAKDFPLVITGTVDIAEETTKILALEIVPLSEASEKRSSRVDVYLPDSDCSPHLLMDVREVLSRHSGGSPVFLHLRSSGGRQTVVAAGNRFLVSVGEALKRDLESLLGREGVRFS
jgi:DNA polymerase-3 subunit alpha